MPVHCFYSRYFGQVSHDKYKGKLSILKDPVFFNKRDGQERFMLSAQTMDQLEDNMNLVSTLIEEHLTHFKTKQRHPKAPPPLKGLIL